MTNWDYSRVAYAFYHTGQSLIIVHTGQQDQTCRRVCHWQRVQLTEEDKPLSFYLNELGLTLIPELLPDSQLKLL